MNHDVIIVGGGAAGLTAAAYTVRSGRTAALFEQQEHLGGLVQSVSRNGFTFDMGLRAIEDSGIIRPMLADLGLTLPQVRSRVSVGIGDRVIRIESKASLEEYRRLLESFFPGYRQDIDRIMQVIRRIMGHMDVLYGIENPLFKDLKSDYSYLVKTLLPWMFKFLFTIGKINRMNGPIEEFLAGLTDSASLRCMIGQHFFKGTPAFFAMSYFSVYLDYLYPLGGTGALMKVLEQDIRKRGVRVETGRRIVRIDPDRRTVTDEQGNTDTYGRLIWCGNLASLYAAVDSSSFADSGAKQAVAKRKAELARNRGGDSVFSLFLAVNRDPAWFKEISEGHFFYTPDPQGLGDLRTAGLERLWKQLAEIAASKDEAAAEEAVRIYTAEFLARNTFEISIPVLKDPTLAPPGKTGLIVSCLFESSLMKRSAEGRWYDRFKDFCSTVIIDVLSRSIYPGLSEVVIEQFVTTPLTLENLTGNADGAITGWSFETGELPVPTRMQEVSKAVRTPIPNVLKAGQWTFSPSGLPISILTGKLAADRALRELAGGKRRGRPEAERG